MAICWTLLSIWLILSSWGLWGIVRIAYRHLAMFSHPLGPKHDLPWRTSGHIPWYPNDINSYSHIWQFFNTFWFFNIAETGPLIWYTHTYIYISKNVIFLPWVTEKISSPHPGRTLEEKTSSCRRICIGFFALEIHRLNPPIFTNINIRNMVVNQWIDMDKHDDKNGYVQRNTHVQPPKFTISRMKNKNYLKHSKPAGRSVWITPECFIFPGLIMKWEGPGFVVSTLS